MIAEGIENGGRRGDEGHAGIVVGRRFGGEGASLARRWILSGGEPESTRERNSGWGGSGSWSWELETGEEVREPRRAVERETIAASPPTQEEDVEALNQPGLGCRDMGGACGAILQSGAVLALCAGAGTGAARGRAEVRRC